MREFKFNDSVNEKLLELKIADKVLSFNPLSAKVMRASTRYLKENQIFQDKIAEAKNSTGLTDGEKIKKLEQLTVEACESVANTIDDILGAGSYSVIFDDRVLNYDEHMDLVGFIFDSIAEDIKMPLNEHTVN